MPAARPPRLPEPVSRKLYKTGQTRGATPAEIYQNRVARRSTVLVPYAHWEECQLADAEQYEYGAIALIDPRDYFRDPNALADLGLRLGENALVFYTRRADWETWPPATQGWQVASSRLPPLGGHHVARIAATTGADGAAIRLGFTSSTSRGAGIRVYEYASRSTIELVRLQLEGLLWLCVDATEVFAQHGMRLAEIEARQQWLHAAQEASGADLMDFELLRVARMVGPDDHTVCPLCLHHMSASMLFDRVEQAAGRERFDTTITEASLFHIAELRVGQLGHKPYNVGWGHHHCNVTVKDAGVPATLDWMREVVARNR